MEYMQGKTIHHLQEADKEIYAKHVMKFIFITTFFNGVTHGDLHVGNILFLEDTMDKENSKKICVLDFGIIYEMSEGRHALFDIFTDMFSTATEIIAKKVLFAGLIEPVEIIKSLSSEQTAPMLKIIDIFLNETIHINKRLHPVRICKFLNKLNRYVNQSKIKELKLKASTDLVKFQVIFGMLHGVLLTLCGNDYLEIADKVMSETFHL
jgi:predicted unusual protein kinase regulating ubiquinone biosynthesis (AarF/ABC1/UbiB family)